MFLGLLPVLGARGPEQSMDSERNTVRVGPSLRQSIRASMVRECRHRCLPAREAGHIGMDLRVNLHEDQESATQHGGPFPR